MSAVGAGAEEYFGKDVSELTLSECAVLASISRSPTNYNPFTNPENLITRRNHVLAEMRNQGYITEEECNAAMAETITLAETSDVNDTKAYSSNNSYFTEAVITQLTKDLMEVYGYETVAEAQSHIFNDGLRIYSTVDPEVQTALENLMLNEADENGNELFPALWHEEEVRSNIPVGSEITYDSNGLPMNPTDETASSIFSTDDIPVYTDSTNTTFKTGSYTATTATSTSSSMRRSAPRRPPRSSAVRKAARARLLRLSAVWAKRRSTAAPTARLTRTRPVQR